LFGALLLQRAKQIGEMVKRAKHVHIVTHHDADGITAGAIAKTTVERLGNTCSLECVKQLDDSVHQRLAKEKYELVWFTDLGSSISTEWKDVTKVITDHHTCSKQSNSRFHLNPHIFSYDGSVDISGAGVTYLVSKAINQDNGDLSALAIVGAIGDLQDRKNLQLTGLNRQIIQDGQSHQVIDVHIDLRYFGKETRPLAKLLQYGNDPIIPEISGREDACSAFIQSLEIPVTRGDYERRWIDLEAFEKQLILSTIAQRLLAKGFGHHITKRLIGEVYTLTQEQLGTEVHDAMEFATLLNSTARYNKHDIGVNVCMGDRGKSLEEARNLLLGHRQNIVEGIQVAKEEQITKRTYVQYFHAKHGIRDTIVGIVTNMLLNSEEVDCNLPLLGFAFTEKGDVKVSARGNQSLIDRGLNLSTAMRKAASQVKGVGGGHNIAAGATIPKGKEEEFLEAIELILRDQLS
jgi:RecJ-like exonuclease